MTPETRAFRKPPRTGSRHSCVWVKKGIKRVLIHEMSYENGFGLVIVLRHIVAHEAEKRNEKDREARRIGFDHKQAAATRREKLFNLK